MGRREGGREGGRGGIVRKRMGETLVIFGRKLGSGILVYLTTDYMVFAGERVCSHERAGMKGGREG